MIDLRILIEPPEPIFPGEPPVVIGPLLSVASLAGGMSSGKPSVALLIADPGTGYRAIGQTSVQMFLNAAAAFKGKYFPEPIDLSDHGTAIGTIGAAIVLIENLREQQPGLELGALPIEVGAILSMAMDALRELGQDI